MTSGSSDPTKAGLPGRLHIMAGPPAWKTELMLIEFAKRYPQAHRLGWDVVVFHRQEDDDSTRFKSQRRGLNLSVDGKRYDPSHPEAILDYARRSPNVKIIGVDDAQFIPDSQKLGMNLDALAADGHQVFAVGTDVDYFGNPIPSIAYLLALADQVEKVRGSCACCGNEGTRSLLPGTYRQREHLLRELSVPDQAGLVSPRESKALCKACFYEVDQAGELSVIVGPMFSGKTLTLIRYVERLERAGTRFQAFYPAHGERGEPGKIMSQGVAGQKLTVEATPVDAPEEIEAAVADDSPHYVLIDEAHLIEHSTLIAVVDRCLKKGINVLAAGLDLDHSGEPFNWMPDILALADNVEKLTAVCEHENCDSEATRTGRKEERPERIIIGDDTLYKALCRHHHSEYVDQILPKVAETEDAEVPTSGKTFDEVDRGHQDREATLFSD